MLNPQEGTHRPAKERAMLIEDDDATEAVGSSRIRIKRGEGSGGFEVITCVSHASFSVVCVAKRSQHDLECVIAFKKEKLVSTSIVFQCRAFKLFLKGCAYTLLLV